MNKLKRLLKIALIGLIGLIMVMCQKQDLNSDAGIDLKAKSINLSNTSDYLSELIVTIEDMVIDGILNKGNANALIVKISNAIKSINKGNITASNGQLNAFIFQVEDFIITGIIPIESGQALITRGETAIALLNSSDISLVNTTWDFTVNWSETVSWHADVTFYADGTTKYDEPEYPGIYTMYGTWSLNGNVLDYVMDASGGFDPYYHFTGTLSGNTMSGTFTNWDGLRPWSATLR